VVPTLFTLLLIKVNALVLVTLALSPEEDSQRVRRRKSLVLPGLEACLESLPPPVTRDTQRNHVHRMIRQRTQEEV